MTSMKTSTQAGLHVQYASAADLVPCPFLCEHARCAWARVLRNFYSVELTGAFSPTDIGIWEPHTHYGSGGALSACTQPLSARCRPYQP